MSKTSLLFVFVIAALIASVSCVSGDDTGSGYKEGYVLSSIGTNLYNDYDDTSTASSIEHKIQIEYDLKDRVWDWYKISDHKVTLDGGVDWDDIPHTVGDPFMISMSRWNNDETVGSGTIYFSKSSDDGGYYVTVLWDFETLNTTWLQGIAVDTIVYPRSDFTVIDSYYNAQTKGAGNQQATEMALYGICLLNAAGGTSHGSKSGTSYSYMATAKNFYQVCNNATEKKVKIIREGAALDAYSVRSKLHLYDSNGAYYSSPYQTTNETFNFISSPFRMSLNFSATGGDEIEFWNDLGAAGKSLTLYGYVFDAKDGFVVSTVSLDFGPVSGSSDANGHYVFSPVYSGVETLSGSKTGYQDFTIELNISSSLRYDVPLIKNETVNSGTCTVAGVVLDSTTKNPIENALVVIENTSYDSYVYTNEFGYFVFYDLSNTTYTLTGSKDEYYYRQLDITLADLDTAYYYQLVLVSEAEEPELTPTPAPGDEKPIIDGISMIFELFGLAGYMGYIFAFLCIAILGSVFGCICSQGGNSLGFLMGGFFGYVISAAVGWLPIWTVAVVICVVIFFVVKQVSKE